MKRLWIVGVLMLLVGCGGPAPGYVTRAEFGERWPLTVDDGTLSCVFRAVLFTKGSTIYAVNGVAQQSAKDRGWHDITEIWADDTSTGAKKDIGPLIDRGQQLCRS